MNMDIAKTFLNSFQVDSSSAWLSPEPWLQTPNLSADEPTGNPTRKRTRSDGPAERTQPRRHHYYYGDALSMTRALPTDNSSIRRKSRRSYDHFNRRLGVCRRINLSAFNIIGFAIGFTVCIIIAYVYRESSVNSFFPSG